MEKKVNPKIEKFMNSEVEPTVDQFDMFEQLTAQYSGKKEEEILQDLQKLNDEMIKDREKYKKNMEALDGLKGFLDKEQKSKLEEIIKFLNKK